MAPMGDRRGRLRGRLDADVIDVDVWRTRDDEGDQLGYVLRL